MARMIVAALRSAVVVPLFFLFTMVMAAIVVGAAMVNPRGQTADRVIRSWSRAFLAAGGVSLTVEGRERFDPGGQYVFVANHLSNFDIPVMFLATLMPIRYLAKKEVYKIPVVATAMRKIGIVKVDRQAGSSIHAAVNEGVAAAKARGHSLIIFPEGTRSDDGEFQSFKKGAFRIAVANQLPIVPVTIVGTWEAWAPGRKVFFPGPAKAVIHDPVPTGGLLLSDIESVRDQVHRVIGKTYEELRESVVGSQREP